MTCLMEHGFDHFLTVGTYVFFRKKNFIYIIPDNSEGFLNSQRKTNFWAKSHRTTTPSKIKKKIKKFEKKYEFTVTIGFTEISA